MSWKFDDSKPVYQQIVEEIQRRILNGQYKSGQRLLSVRELAVEAAVNPNTMQRALQELERTGIIYTERTSGKFVTEDGDMITTLKDTFAKDIVEVFVKSLREIGFSDTEIIKTVSEKIQTE